ncbi:MAG TPA: bifunctional diguanylate cyclase/phosphodiesterase, partial [Euzebya sp.]|nr:bifunctional diguanylate cyclase/phosphodiesterase [Euzebya sp.]
RWGLQQDAESGMILAVALNVTDHKRVTRALRHEADHDPLTGAANRVLVMRTLNEWAAGATPAAVAIIDVDGFKLVNDRMGHRVGDAVLRTLVARLRELVPENAVVGRMGGDEFVVLAPVARREGLAQLEAQLSEVSGPITVLDCRVRLSVSIGLTHGGDADPEHLLHQADVAAYVAKRDGGGRVQRYDESLRAEDAHRTRIEQHLTDALAGDGVELRLQPILSLVDRAVVGAEALARLRGPEGLIEAAEFIAIADGVGLMRRVAQRVQALALTALADLPAHVRLFLNMDSEDLLAGDGLQAIVDMAVGRGLSPDRLVIELAESTLMRDIESAVQQMRSVRAQGVAFAIDDFGVGLSSLSTLNRLPIDLLKIDRSFVAAARTDHAARAVLGAVAGIGPALGVDVVLQGVETETDLALAYQLGVTAVQGWQLGSPMSPGELASALGTG